MTTTRHPLPFNNTSQGFQLTKSFPRERILEEERGWASQAHPLPSPHPMSPTKSTSNVVRGIVASAQKRDGSRASPINTSVTNIVRVELYQQSDVAAP